MDNYRHPMYTRYNRNMGAYQNTPCDCGATPILEVVAEKHCDKCERCDKSEQCDKHEQCDRHEQCDKREQCDKCEHYEKREYCDKDYGKKLDELPLAMAYVPFQKWRKVSDGACGLAVGTIFQELDLPFYGSKNNCGCRGDRS